MKYVSTDTGRLVEATSNADGTTTLKGCRSKYDSFEVVVRGDAWKREYIPVEEDRPLSDYAKGMMAFALDRAFLSAVGNFQDSRRGWEDLSDAERIAWIRGEMDVGGSRLRRELYDGLKAIVDKFALKG